MNGVDDEAGGQSNRNINLGGVSRGNVGTDTLGKAKDGDRVNKGHVTFSLVRGTCRRVAPFGEMAGPLRLERRYAGLEPDALTVRRWAVSWVWQDARRRAY